MALLVRRPSEWSVVLRTETGQQISFDRSNRRIRSTRTQRKAENPGDLNCPLCHQRLPNVDEEVVNQETFVHPEYFGFLEACLAEEADHLHQESFNNGYFERFFVPEGLLGRGGRGEVIKVRHILEGVSLGVFALKRITVGDSQTWLLRMLREVQSLRFKHDNLVAYNHVWLEYSQINSFGPRVPVLHILQQYCSGGDLESFVLKHCGKLQPSVDEMKQRTRRRSKGQTVRPEVEGLQAEMIYSFFRDILSGLACLHEQNIIHRDMKPSNCLLDQALTDDGYPRVLVSDFGEAQFDGESLMRSGGTGTLAYTAPEIVRGESWTTAADIFSLGLILYFLTHEGSLPYRENDANFEALRGEISNYPGYQRKKVLTSELETVLAQLLAPNPEDRPSCSDLIAMMQVHDVKTKPNASVLEVWLPEKSALQIDSTNAAKRSSLLALMWQKVPVQKCLHWTMLLVRLYFTESTTIVLYLILLVSFLEDAFDTATTYRLMMTLFIVSVGS